MSDVPFHRTQMGHRFYEHTVPELARNLGRVADLLEKLVVALDRAAPPAPTERDAEPRR
ncbi:MAG: hypothetical protein IT374_03195 [Polyangiaceae bacterium]|nr:hypothetical protein [Polyangiaceae bacterium]